MRVWLVLMKLITCKEIGPLLPGGGANLRTPPPRPSLEG